MKKPPVQQPQTDLDGPTKQLRKPAPPAGPQNPPRR